MKISIMVLIVMSGLLFFACSEKAAVELKENVHQIKVDKIVSFNISNPVFASGKVASSSEKKLAFKTGGIIKTINVREGEAVKKGKPIATLDLSEITPRYNQALNAFEKSKRDHERVKNLYADSVASLEQLQDTKTALDVAEANLSIAAFNLENSKIIAPSDGVILKKLAETKEVIGQGVPVVLFGTDKGAWSIKVGVADRNIVKLSMEDSVEIRLDAFPDEILGGKINSLGSFANPYNGTYEVEIEFLPENLKMRSGYVGKVTIYPAAKQNYKLVPVESLVEGNGDEGFVFTVGNSNRVKKSPVRIAFVYGDKLALKDGPEEGEVIATSGAQYLTDNSIVNISR